MKWQTKTVLLAVSLCTAAVLAGQVDAKVDARGATACEYKLGTLLPLTGAIAFLGKSDLVGATAAVRSINGRGGVGTRGCKIRLFVEDTQSTTSVAVTRLQSLLDKKIYGLVGPQPGSDSLAVAPILEKAKTAACSLSSTISVTQLGNPYLFRCQATDIVSVIGAILFAKKRFNATSLALLHTDDAYGTQASSAFDQVSKSGATKIDIAANLPVSYNGTDFTAQWSRAMASRPDAILVWATGNPAATLLRNAKQVGVNVPIIGGSGMTGAAIAPAGADANGLYAMNLFDPAKPTRLQQRAITAIRSKEGKSYQVSLFELLAWDAVHVFAEALKKYPRNSRLGLESIRHLTLTEGTYTFGPKKHDGIGVSSLVITQMRNGNPVGVIRGSELVGK